VIDAQLVKDQPIIFLVFRQQVFQPFLAPGLLLLDGLDEIELSMGASAVGAVTQ
jgi:hypothetical protein